MKKRLLALILTVVMALSLFSGVALAKTQFELDNSRETSAYLEIGNNTHYFTVPCDGYVTVDVMHTRGVNGTYVVYSLTSGSKTYLDKRNVGYIIANTSKRIFEGYLPAGEYKFTACCLVGENTMSSELKNDRYTINWNFTCSHKSTTDNETIAATCSENGKIERVCDHCKEIVKTTTTDKLPHTPDGEWVTVTEPTCSRAGSRTQTCTVCGGMALEETIEKLPHEAEWKTTKEATCAGQGRQDYVCSVCKEIVETKSIPALEHTFGSWKTTKEGNCSTQGERERECSVCGYKDKQKTDPDDDHDFSSWRVEVYATCDQKGKETRYCYLCNKEESRTTAQLDHAYGSWTVTTKAICSQDGIQYRTCKNCNDQETQTIPKLPHTNERVDLGVTNGKKTYKDRCTVCGYEGKTYYEGAQLGREVSITKANSSTPTVIVLVVPAFSDVSSSSWYQSVVTYAYNLGLMVGNSETTFNPLGNVTVAEAVTMAARARNSYDGGTNDDFKSSSVWYQTYVDYAVKKGIIQKGDFDNYERVATRAEMAYIFAHALPEAGIKAINKVTSLPDVNGTTKYSKEIFSLYNAGILTGSDAAGTFSPDKPITRSEAAAIITRLTLSSERKTLTLK